MSSILRDKKMSKKVTVPETVSRAQAGNEGTQYKKIDK